MIIRSASDFVNSVVQIWPPYRWDEVQEKAWTQLMVRNLSGFSPDVLDRAFQDMVSKRKETRIPTPAECIQACVEAKRWVDGEANAGKLPGLGTHPSDEWSTERCKLAYDLIKSAMGKQAATDNPSWVLGLWHFCRRFQRLPSETKQYEPRSNRERQEYGGCTEVVFCKRSAWDFDEAYEKCLRGDVGPLSPMLAKLGASMLAKREKLREEVLR